MRIFSHRKKFFFLGGIIALLVVAGAALTFKLKPEEASATGQKQVDLQIPGNSSTGSYFTIDGGYAWCITPRLANPDRGNHTATVYTFDELKSGKAANGDNISNIQRMFIAYYYAKEQYAVYQRTQDHNDWLHSYDNNQAMRWALVYLYNWNMEYPADGANGKAIFDYYKKGFPSNLSDGSVSIVNDQSSQGRQTIFTADYTVKTTYTQKLQINKVWRDGIDADSHDISIQFKVKDNTTNTYVVIDNDEIGELNANNNWMILKTFERDSQESPHSFSVEEIVTGSGFHTNTDSVTGDEFWYHDSLKVGDDYIYYVMPSSDTQGCDESDPNSVVCTMYNKEYGLKSVSIWPTKRWNDAGYTDYRPESIQYIIHAFVQVNGTYHEVEGLPKTGYAIPKSNTYHLENTYTWGGTYVPGMATQAEYNGEMYPVTYAIEEVSVPTNYGLSCGEDLTYEGKTYCLASEKADGSGDYVVEWTNTIQKIKLYAKKHWNDGGNVAQKRPEAVAFNIFRSVNGGEPEFYRTTYMMPSDPNSNDWSMALSLVKTDKDGNEYEYTYQEVDYYDRNIESFTSTNYIMSGDVIGFLREDEMDASGLINTAKTEIPVKKCFVDEDKSKRPMSLDFELFSNSDEIEVQNLILTSMNERDDGCWYGTFENLPVYDSTGEEIIYTVEEDDSLLTDYELDEEYSVCEVDAVANFAADDGNKKSCLFYNVELIDIPVIKVWEEDSKEDRPGSIEVSLLCGDDVLDTVTLSEENNLDGDNTWEYTWKNRRIDECEQGYSVAENINIPGYATKITGNAEDGFVITNTKTLDEIMTWGSLGAGSFGAIAAGFFVVKRKLFARY